MKEVCISSCVYAINIEKKEKSFSNWKAAHRCTYEWFLPAKNVKKKCEKKFRRGENFTLQWTRWPE